jgi:glycosyltransferase involved in cell wall biosynthesis
MKIAFLGPSPPFRGGISQFALMLALEYERRGDEVRMFTYIRQYPAFLFPGGKQTAGFDKYASIHSEQAFTPYQPWTWGKAVRRIRDFAPELVIVSYFLPWFAPSQAWICARLKGIRVVCLVHNVNFHEYWVGANLLTRMALKRADRIVTLSRSSLDDLKRITGGITYSKAINGFHPLYDCYQTLESEKGRQGSDGRTALFFGLIKPYKGLDVLLKALTQARIAVPQLKLLVAGEVYGSKDRYLKLIRQLGLTEAVEAEFRYVGEDEVASYFQRADVCVLPYKSATQSGVIATAYSFGLPVIASDVGGLGEYVKDGETGLLVPPGDPEALAAALIRYFREGLKEKFGAAIPAYRESLSWARLADLIRAE